MSTDLRDEDWQRLREMRAAFLESDAVGGSTPAWSSRRDLELYDATFAQRIGWKWSAVLRELARRGVPLPGGVVLDWGCGTGIAARAFAAAAGAGAITRVELFDRSPEAREFAAERLRAEQPSLEVAPVAVPRGAPDVLLVSHVLNELDDAGLAELTALARACRQVVWVENGSRATARALQVVRESLRGDLEVRAPCTHREACGLLVPGRERDWCHHFATPPAEAFTSRRWTRFAQELGIDLRSLPYAFLVMSDSSPRPSEPGVGRILGRPRIGKGHALVDWCDASGVRTLRLLERHDPQLLRSWKKSTPEAPLFRGTIAGERLAALETWTPE